MQLVPHDININFIKNRFVTFAIAGILSLTAIFGFVTKGLNYGIDFKGGYILEVAMPEEVNLEKVREQLSELNLGDVTLQQFGGPKELLIRFENYEDGALERIQKALGPSVDYRRIQTVGPKVGAELVQNGIKAVSLALIAMLIYIAIRFEWQFAVCAILALAHDCIAIFGMFSLFPLEFNETAIIAILITAGYSINDTIVIFDRIRENMRRYKRKSRDEIINQSINETLSRTIMTASTTLIALLALYFFGGPVISAFSLPIIIGIVIGSFSSICLASPLLIYIKSPANLVQKEV